MKNRERSPLYSLYMENIETDLLFLLSVRRGQRDLLSIRFDSNKHKKANVSKKHRGPPANCYLVVVVVVVVVVVIVLALVIAVVVVVVVVVLEQ